MSRSNPTTANANPSQRWFEWDGANGIVRYYDKNVTENKGNVECPLPFTFIVLDQLSTIRGWHKSSDSGIFANEVRDTKKEKILVKAFKGGEIANGLYAEIKDKVAGAGGEFHSSIYIAFKDAGEMKIGNLSLKGAAVNSWIEFQKKDRKAVDEKAIVITGYTEGQKGKITYRVPVFQFKDITPSSQEVAVELDKELQVFLTAYLGKPKPEEEVQQHPEVVSQEPDHIDDGKGGWKPIEEPKPMGLSQEELDSLPF